MSTSTPDITKKFYEFTVSGGTGSQALPDGMANELIQIIIIAPSKNATYHFYISESIDSLRIFERPAEGEDITGNFNELVIPNLPLWGNHTLVVYGATKGTYKLRIVYR